MNTIPADNNAFAFDSMPASWCASAGRRNLIKMLGGAALLAQFPAWAVPDMNQQGLTGMWYEPTSSGQGLALEVYPNLSGAGVGLLQAGWFTYDIAPAGGVEKQRWYTFAGAVTTGATTATLPIYRNSGGNFNTGPVTSGTVVGSAIVSFSSCTSGQLVYNFTDGSNRAGVMPLLRITPNVTCSETAARPTNADFAHSGNWFDPATSGQGFIIEMNPVTPVVFFAWYTYAVGGQVQGIAGQRWFTGQGAYSPGSQQANVILYETTGGIFDTDTPASQKTVAVGTATLTFASCSRVVLGYTFTGGSNAGLAGNITLSRTGPVPAGCA